jgi:hypothetical protein
MNIETRLKRVGEFFPIRTLRMFQWINYFLALNCCIIVVISKQTCLHLFIFHDHRQHFLAQVHNQLSCLLAALVNQHNYYFSSLMLLLWMRVRERERNVINIYSFIWKRVLQLTAIVRAYSSLLWFLINLTIY